jgi:hypothetical protein
MLYDLYAREHGVSSCHEDSMTANFPPLFCSPAREADKNVQNGFFLHGDLQPATGFSRDLRPVTSIVRGKG